MSNHDVEEITSYIKSPDLETVILGYSMIITDGDFKVVKELYGLETHELPDKFNNFAHVCEYLQRWSCEHEYMESIWPRNADTLYRPVAQAVLSRICRLKIKAMHKMKTCPNPKCKTKGIPDDAQFCPVCGCELKEKSKPQLVDAELTAAKTTIRKFRATTISWAAKGAKTVKLDGELLPCPGTKQVFPRGTKKYVVEFLDEKEEVIGSKSITIEVTPNWNILIIFIAILSLVGIIAAFSS